MRSVIISLLVALRASLRPRVALQLEILALRHQLQVLERTPTRRVRLTRSDRLLWIWLSRVWREWRPAVVIVKPETVLAWHRRGFRLLWTWKSRHRPGRPAVPPDVRALIRTMSDANPLWGAPRIHGELVKPGIDISQATVAKYMLRRRRPPSQTWRTFLANHVDQIAAADFFVVPTATYRLLSRSRTRWGYCTSNGGVDGATAPRGVSRKRGPALSHTRSRPHLCRAGGHSGWHGHRGTLHGPSFPVAERERLIGSIRRALMQLTIDPAMNRDSTIAVASWPIRIDEVAANAVP